MLLCFLCSCLLLSVLSLSPGYDILLRQVFFYDCGYDWGCFVQLTNKEILRKTKEQCKKERDHYDLQNTPAKPRAGVREFMGASSSPSKSSSPSSRLRSTVNGENRQHSTGHSTVYSVGQHSGSAVLLTQRCTVCAHHSHNPNSSRY